MDDDWIEDVPPRIDESPPVYVIPEPWKPFLREADLTRMCLATGLNAMARANHLENGLYSQAFFNVSIGLERLLKLIYLVDYATTHGGSFPSRKTLQRELGHDLARLFGEAQVIRNRLADDGHDFGWTLVDADLAQAIIEVLSEFARSTRYYNLDYLVGGSGQSRDPLQAWARDVQDKLAENYPARQRANAAQRASDLQSLLGDAASIMQMREDGSHVTTLYEAGVHEALGKWVQQKATYHCATIVRYLAEILRGVTWRAIEAGVAVPFLFEFFATDNNPASYLQRRRAFL